MMCAGNDTEDLGHGVGCVMCAGDDTEDLGHGVSSV